MSRELAFGYAQCTTELTRLNVSLEFNCTEICWFVDDKTRKIFVLVLVDVYRRDAPVQRNPFLAALYISLFPQLIGWGRTKQLLYTAENISAEEALGWGLVEKVVEPHALDSAVEHWVSAIVKADPQAIRLQRELIRHWEAMPVNDAIEEGIRIFTRACESPQPAKLVAQVIERLKQEKS